MFLLFEKTENSKKQEETNIFLKGFFFCCCDVDFIFFFFMQEVSVELDVVPTIFLSFSSPCVSIL
jgi:hypothetical protein